MRNKKNSINIDKKTLNLFRVLIKVLEPRPVMTISEWAERYRYLSGDASA